MTKIYVYPQDLRSKSNSDQGFPHISFLADDANNDFVDPVKIHLYVPQGFSVPDAASYGTTDFGLLGNSENAASEALSEKSFGQSVKLFLNNILGKVGAEELSPLATKQLIDDGITLNPNTAVAFETVQLRSFNFQFKMVSESAEEAQQIFRIENEFRRALYPTMQGISLRYPPKFRIQFLHGKKVSPYMPRILPSYLINMTTAFNSSTNMFHADGSPSEVDLSLTFQETKLITRDKLYDTGSDGLGNENNDIYNEIRDRRRAIEAEREPISTSTLSDLQRLGE